MKSLEFKALNKYLKIILSFFTDKKFFIQRLVLTMGIFLQISECYIKGNYNSIINWKEWGLLILACFIFGAMIQIPLLLLADIFCKEKTYNNIIKFNNDNYTTEDLKYITDVLGEKSIINKNTSEIIKYLLEDQQLNADNSIQTKSGNVEKIKEFINSIK